MITAELGLVKAPAADPAPVTAKFGQSKLGVEMMKRMGFDRVESSPVVLNSVSDLGFKLSRSLLSLS